MMTKETKKFFDTNRLNKGYNGTSINKQSDVQLVFRKNNLVLSDTLPDTGVLAEYEEISPGSTSKIFNMAQTEQNHRHSFELLKLEKNNRVVKICILSFIIVVAMITIGTVILALNKYYFISSLFSISAFFTIGVVLIIHPSKRSKSKLLYNNKIHNYKKRRLDS